jgi:hypothetical protein
VDEQYKLHVTPTGELLECAAAADCYLTRTDW